MALGPSTKPTKVCFVLLGCNLVNCPSFRIQTGLPNSCRCETSGLHPHHASSGVFDSSACIWDRFRRYVAWATASGQRNWGVCVEKVMARVSLAKVRFIHSATLFCAGECGAVYSSLIPFDAHHPCRSPVIYSPPLSTRNRLGDMLYWHSR